MAETLQIQRFADRMFAENCYLVHRSTGSRAMVIDPGLQADDVLAEVQSRGLTVEWIVNTHGHIDHVAGNRRVADATGARLILHPGDAALLRALPQQKTMIEEMGLPLPVEIRESPEPDAWFEDGGVFEFDEVRFEVLHTPGHSPGGVCLRHEGTVFVGDTLFQGSIGRTDLTGGSMPQLVRSIRENLFRLPGDTVCWPGHGEPTTVADEREFNPFVSDRAIGARLQERR
jgi:glyoxylase-like metal-dependent hydrolase (beta-lactamase superfamily II)